MSTDTRWIIGTILTVAALLISLMLSQHASISDRLSGIESRMSSIEVRMNSMESSFDARLLSIEEHLRAAPEPIEDPKHP